MQANIAEEARQGRGQIAEPSRSIGQVEVEERFFDFALNFVDPAKAHPVGDFRRKKEIVRTRFA
jgi:hypothetical protein